MGWESHSRVMDVWMAFHTIYLGFIEVLRCLSEVQAPEVPARGWAGRSA